LIVSCDHEGYTSRIGLKEAIEPGLAAVCF